MSPRIPRARLSGPRRQHGAIGLMAALTLGTALLFMLVVIDSGRLYMEQRKLQRVVDMAALEAASRGGDCAIGATATTYATESAIRNGFPLPDNTRTLAVACGTLVSDANHLRTFSADPNKNEVIRVRVSQTVPRSIAAGVGALFGGAPADPNINLTAMAVASVAPPVAALTIRSTLLSVDTSKSAILNQLFGGLLGGNLNVSVAGWNGLIDTNIDLLGYLDRLKIDIGLTAAGYDQVLSNTIDVSQLIQTTVNVLDPNGTLGATATIMSLQALKVAAGTTEVVLGNMLHIESGTKVSALDVDLQLFSLIESVVQLANKKNGLVAQLPIDLAGLAQITARVQVLEPPQMSAIGNPQKAAIDPLGPDRIYVRTAQVRTLLSINLPVLDAIIPLVNAVTNLAAPLTNTLNALLGLDLVGTIDSLSCLLGAPCEVPDIELLPAPVRIDVALDAASANSYVTAYSCVSSTNKTLTSNTTTSVVDLKIGQIDPSAAFGTNIAPPAVVVKPLKVIDIGVKTCRKILLLPVSCDPRIPSVGGGIGVYADTTVGQNANMSHMYASPNLPEISMPPFYYTYATSNVVSSLTNTVDGLHVDMYTPASGNLLGNLVSGLGSILSTVTDLLITAIKTVLNPLLDTLINTLLASLGIDLNKVEVGANLSCHAGRVSLVM
ncbi:pilus assembly protein TadG-related protein [Pseudomonas sp. LS1212]|uniref:pilus assembly protein TadG-related protein n=1 Tax=Pseudomonas sp. LS1212 TaxID=2972478 RepID=UPI00215BFB0F|nr:pilus assembly protein TadG-related protein [Pseudomonas sp. LS1212]UVJ44590.1 pilus assembly protein TadG-related protein [Pseudomonas sp. LS1212]